MMATHQRSSNDRRQNANSCSASCFGNIAFLFLFAAGVTMFGGAVVRGGLASPLECAVNGDLPWRVRRYCLLISHHASAHELDPLLIAAVITVESSGNPQAYSHSGAVGLMQVMPRDGPAAEFECGGQPCFGDRPTTQELKDPDLNIRTGTALLASLLRAHNGDLREALKAYGPFDADYAYADKILALYRPLR
ncbi:MAG TPA: transglycosylase SLT domain-containing protein [Anaerolineales bacterium]|nr:transglycosylase SLT domain-containing protein [Anaerolineales bacterium]